MKLKKRDVAVLAVLMLGALLPAAALALGRTEGTTVVIKVAGKEVAAFSQCANTTYCIEGINGGHDYLVIEDGTVWLEDADCPDKLCVQQGRIRYVGQSILCLPNRVSVMITGTDADASIDAVAS